MGAGGGVTVVEREGCDFTCFGAAVVVVFAGTGVLALTVSVVSGVGVLLTSSGETAAGSCIALGYKSPIAAWIVLGYKSLDTVAGAAVRIVTNENTEMTGTRTRDHLLLNKVFIFFILSLLGGVV